jgi:hypothetical protein
MLFKVFYAVCANTLKSQVGQLSANRFLLLDDCYNVGGINFAEYLGRSEAEFAATDDPKIIHCASLSFLSCFCKEGVESDAVQSVGG